MTFVNFLRLLLTAALWGGSFIIIRACTPLLGPAVLTEVRVVLATLFLFLIGVALKKRISFTKYLRYFIILGLLSAALPFFLFAYSAQWLPGSLLSIINATSPSWGFIFACVKGSEKLTTKKVLGLILGFIGVTLLIDFEQIELQNSHFLAYLCAIIASMSYGLASNIAVNSEKIDAFQNTLGSMTFSTLMLLPLILWFPVKVSVTLDIIGLLLLFGTVCTGLAFLIYFKLIEEIGPSSALTVTFLVPIFGVLWGFIFLNEKVSPFILLSLGCILYGTMLVTEYRLTFEKIKILRFK